MNIRWLAVLVSWVVDIGGTNVFALVFFTALLASGAMPLAVASDQQVLMAWLLARPELFAITVIGGTFFSVLAGYVAARMAGRAMLLHGLLSSFACLASDVVSRDQLTQVPVWVAVLGIVLAPAAGIAGGYIRQLEARRVEPAAA